AGCEAVRTRRAVLDSIWNAGRAFGDGQAVDLARPADERINSCREHTFGWHSAPGVAASATIRGSIPHGVDVLGPKGIIFGFSPTSWKVDGTMALDVGDGKTLLAPALQVTWIGPQRPVEGGTVFVKPLAEDDAADNEITADSVS
ncbi:MAG TPA: hypothetical protein VGN22_08760, partial [Pseudonocardia sp.]